MTPRRENLLKKIKEIGKNIPVIETYRNGRLVLSNIENANEEMVQTVEISEDKIKVDVETKQGKHIMI